METQRAEILIHRLEGMKAKAQAHLRQGFPLRFAESPRLATDWWFTAEFACPLCRSKQILRSHRRSRLEYLFTPLVLPFRCDNCGMRFFVSRAAL